MADNSAAFGALQAQIDRLNALEGLPKACALPLAEALKEDAAKRIAAATAPDGSPWAPTQAGKAPLQGAAKALTASARGAIAVLTLMGPEALHHSGKARGHVQRRTLPGRATLQGVADTLRRIVDERLEALK